MAADKPPPPPDFDDNPEWTGEDFRRARPASEVHRAKIAAAMIRKGRPPKPATERKQLVSMRIAPDLVAAMRATGPGWQARAEQALRRTFVKAGKAERSSS